MNEQFDTIIIGAGQAGLAVSYFLTKQNREHIILERDRIAEAWRSKKWDSFTLVTPNWMLQLPEFSYEGNHPDGFLKKKEVIQYLEDFAGEFDPPVRTGVEVTSVEPANTPPFRFRLKTTQGAFDASQVIIATGTFQMPNIPDFCSKLPSGLYQIHSSKYRNPDQLPTGSVLVVGSAQSGCQIAEELNNHGRKVYLCTGSADRLPRRYRGRDSFWWAAQLGIFDQTVEDLPSPDTRFKANPQVSGKDGGKTLNLHQLAEKGITLLGRMENADGKKIAIGDDLEDNLAQADKFAAEFKKGVDQLVEKTGIDVPEPEEPAKKPDAGYQLEPQVDLNLEKENIRSVIWATGYDFDYSWIKFPIYDEAGYPVQERGVTEQPGLYFVGLHWLHTRESGLLSGVGDDAAHIAQHIASLH